MSTSFAPQTSFGPYLGSGATLLDKILNAVASYWLVSESDDRRAWRMIVSL